MTKGVNTLLRKSFFFQFVPVSLLALILLLNGRFALAQNAISAAAAPGPRLRHKFQVNDPALGAQIIARGGRLIADYGGYQLYEADAISPALANHSQAEIRDAYNWILLNATPLDTSLTEVQALRKNAGAFAGKHLHLAQFSGPAQPSWREALARTGVRIITYVPHNAYLVYGDASSLARLQRWATTAPEVQWEGPYLDDYKVHPSARTVDAKGRPREIGTGEFAIQLVADAEANTNTLALLEQLKLAPLKRREYVLDYLNIVAPLAPESLSLIAAQTEVVSIQPYYAPHKSCERQDQIAAGNLSGDVPAGPGYLAWLAGKGFTQAQFAVSGFAVDVSDSGIDNGTNSPNHFGLYMTGNLTNASRVIYNRLEGTPNTGSSLAGCDGHGTLNSHIIGGYDDLGGFPFADALGFHFGLGVCPFVKLGSSVIFDPDSFTSPSYNDLQSQAYQSGARISNNSWGSTSTGLYDMDAQSYDALVRDAQPTNSAAPAAGNQEMVIVFAANNDGPNPQTIGSPGSAKNVITVGAGESVQPFGGSDGSGVDDSGADSANDIIDFSSRGPCADGRHKPDLMAPGTHVSGGVFQASQDPGTNGTADACFLSDHTGVSGGPNSSLFFPANQQFYTASSGTSHSTPCVSGGCALLRQYFLNHFTNAPSPAMTKAYLMNSARYMTGLYANDTLWSDNQGMGEMNLGMAFDGTPRILRDEVAADLFTASGQTRTFTGSITDTNKPFRVTIAWTDAPGNTTGSAFNNDLDLTVTVGGNTYKGNVFNGPYSVTGGAADAQNNVESVFLPAGLAGNFAVQVTAMDINSIGVPNANNSNEQDFALVVYNGMAVAAPVILNAGSTLTAESCTNGAVDPGETVTVNFALQNLGTLNTTNLVATLQAGGGVGAPGGPQTYGALAEGGSAVNRPFTFTANGVCGGTVTATLQLQDGPANLGAISFSLPLGQFVSTNAFTENFDGVTAPNLPLNWTTTASGAQSAWVTSAATADSAPNAAYSTDAPAVGLNELVSPPVTIVSSHAQLIFRNNFDLEAKPGSPSLGYDGGVLEIQIGNGPFMDILAAGGSFASGGYTRTISSQFSNPLAGRQAWSGNSGGFITTVVNLPAAAAGQTITLKWRCGTDQSTGAGGWYIDTVSVTDGYFVCCRTLVAPVISGVNVSGTNVSISVSSVGGLNYTLEYKDVLTNAAWSSLPPAVTGTSGTIILPDTNAPTASRFYRVRVE